MAVRGREGGGGESGRRDRSDPNTIASVVFGGKRLGKAVDSGEVEIDGSRQTVNRLFRSLS